MEADFKKERNETYEIFQLLSRKKHIDESLEPFHSVLSGLAARCSFGTLDERILKDVFIINMVNRKAQIELSRSTKTPEEVYRIALFYERGEMYFIGTNGGGLQIRTEAVGIIRGGYRNNRPRGRGQHPARGFPRWWMNPIKRRSCDQPGSTPDHRKSVTCNYCRKTRIMNVRSEGNKLAIGDAEQ